jgi:hypothetical protein
VSLNTTFVAGTTVITAAHMNGIQAAWTSYTPTATNFTVGNGTLTGKWLQLGKTIILRVTFAAGSTTSYTASGMTVSLPTAAVATGIQTMMLRLSTAGEYVASVSIGAGSSTMALEVQTSSGDCRLTSMKSTSPNPGTTGFLIIEGAYEAA